jgi:peptidoglycan/xylan/chitin deacetylase (PgdA/CDA1 family)
MTNTVSSMSASELTVVMYHYVRDLPRSRFPAIKGMLTDDFHRQAAAIVRAYEVLDWPTALAFLTGDYRPTRPPCLLTFDDGLNDHFTNAFPILSEVGAAGVFFVTTACQAEGRVVSAHKNHVLMAELGFAEYRTRFQDDYRRRAPWPDADLDAARRTYRWDEADVALFKLAFNFLLDPSLRDHTLDALFATALGDEREFASTWYLSWSEIREMQRGGMTFGGHAHRHLPLASLSPDEQRRDLAECARILRRELSPQESWPFSYPYGKSDSFNAATIDSLHASGFKAAFTTEVGGNSAGADLFRLRRIDTKDLRV